MNPKGLLATSNRLGLQTLFPVQPISLLHLSVWSASLASPTARPTTPAADFSCAVGKDRSFPSDLRHSHEISRGKLERFPRIPAESTARDL